MHFLNFWLLFFLWFQYLFLEVLLFAGYILSGLSSPVLFGFREVLIPRTSTSCTSPPWGSAPPPRLFSSTLMAVPRLRRTTWWILRPGENKWDPCCRKGGVMFRWCVGLWRLFLKDGVLKGIFRREKSDMCVSILSFFIDQIAKSTIQKRFPNKFQD